MGKKNTKKNNKKNAAKKKKMNMIEGESSAAGEKAVSSERNSTQEPEAAKLGDKRADASSSSSAAGNGKKIDGGDTKAPEGRKEETPQMTERERIAEEDSWIKQHDSSERKPSSVLFAKVPILLFSTKLDSTDADPASNRVALKLCHQRMKEALTLTLNFDKIPYVRVLVRDPQKREHHLRFSRFDGIFSLHHGWDKIVAENGLKEGDIVMGKGIYIDHQYRVVLSFTKDLSRERNLFGSGRTFFLFEKKLDKADLKRLLVISCCSERLKMVLKLTKEPYIRVFAKGEQRMELLELRFSRHGADQGGGGTYILHHQWEKIVAQYGLKEGDLVTGFGNVYSIGFLMAIRVIKKEEMGLPILIQVPILFFEKKLESTDTNDRLAIGSCKDVVKEILARAEKVEDSDDYVRVIATDDRDRLYELRLSRDIPKGGYVLHHQWKDVVAANGLRSGDTVSFWGGLTGDGTIDMRFDVVKA